MLNQDLEELPTTPTPKPTRTAKRRRVDAASIGVGMLIALASTGLYFMHARTLAGVEMIEKAQASASSIDVLLAGGERSIVSLAASLRNTGNVVDRFAQRDNARLASAKPLKQDPFVFESLEADSPTPVNTMVDTSAAQRAQAKSAALAAVRQLQLQSIMYGSTRRSCLIDGKLYFEGQTVADFKIVRITPDATILQTGEFRFELRLRR